MYAGLKYRRKMTSYNGTNKKYRNIKEGGQIL